MTLNGFFFLRYPPTHFCGRTFAILHFFFYFFGFGLSFSGSEVSEFCNKFQLVESERAFVSADLTLNVHHNYEP